MFSPPDNFCDSSDNNLSTSTLFAAFDVVETLKYIQLPPSEAGATIEVKLVPIFKKGFNVVLNSEVPRDFI